MQQFPSSSITPREPVPLHRTEDRTQTSPFPAPMPGIEGIGHALGHVLVDNVAAGKRWGKAPEFIENKIGFLQLRRMSETQNVLSLCEAAFADLVARHALDASTCDCLIVITQNPDGGRALPHISARLHAALELPPSAAAFDLGLGCSGYIYGLSVACSFMQVNGLRQGLLFTAPNFFSATRRPARYFPIRPHTDWAEAALPQMEAGRMLCAFAPTDSLRCVDATYTIFPCGPCPGKSDNAWNSTTWGRKM